MPPFMITTLIENESYEPIVELEFETLSSFIFRENGFEIFWERKPGHNILQRRNRYDKVEEIHIWEMEWGDLLIISLPKLIGAK